MSLGEYAGIGVSIALGLFFLASAVANFRVLANWVLHKETGSMIPFLGGVAGVVALLVLPFPGFSAYWWVPVVLDASFVMTLIGLFRKRAKPGGDVSP